MASYNNNQLNLDVKLYSQVQFQVPELVLLKHVHAS